MRKNENENEKPENHRLAMYRHFYTDNGIQLIQKAIKGNAPLGFMRTVPGVFSLDKAAKGR